MIVNSLQLYQVSSSKIWTDKHISKNLLEAHLNLSEDAASRKIKTIQRTVNYISEFIPEEAKILDLGCGPGLYANLLARRGHSVTGIDISQSSVSYARKKAVADELNIKYYCRDYLRDDIGRGYDLAICIYCDFGALIPKKQLILLEKIKKSLQHDGLFIFDVFQDGLCATMDEKRDWHYSQAEGFWSGKPHLILEEKRHFKKQRVWGSRYIIIDEDHKVRDFITWDHYYTEESIKQLLGENGFQVINTNSKLVDKNDYTSNDVLFVTCKK